MTCSDMYMFGLKIMAQILHEGTRKKPYNKKRIKESNAELKSYSLRNNPSDDAIINQSERLYASQNYM